MGVLCYLVVIFGLFSGCWLMVGEQTARWLFVTVHLGCAMAVLLLYLGELSSSHFAEAQNLDPTNPSRKLQS